MELHKERALAPRGETLMQWAARTGAVTAEAVSELQGATIASARGQLAGAVRRGLLLRQRPLAGHPAIYTPTRAGLRAAGLAGGEPCRVRAGNALHVLTCARVAAGLALAYPEHRIDGEGELRRAEREQCTLLASVRLGARGAERAPVHRPDLVLWAPRGGPPVAVEVELTVKAPQRLAAICKAWARCRRVAGTVYVAAPAVERPLARAIDRAGASDRVAVVPLSVL
jgi:hypothetical protein